MCGDANRSRTAISEWRRLFAHNRMKLAKFVIACLNLFRNLIMLLADLNGHLMATRPSTAPNIARSTYNLLEPAGWLQISATTTTTTTSAPHRARDLHIQAK